MAPLEAEPGDCALELVGRRFGIGGGQGSKGGQAVEMGADCFVQPVIGPARQRHGGFRVELLKPRHRMRQHLQIDPGGVHFSEPQCAEVVEPLDDRRRRDRVQTVEMPFHFRVVVMLLRRNDRRFCRHSFPLSR
jgi:hypothetical protein